MAPKKIKKVSDKNKPVHERSFSKINKVVPRNESQQAYLDLISSKTLVFASGIAGTGKTLLAVYMAIAHHWAKQTKRIIITRPAVEAGEKIGFLPGDIDAKLNPYLRPVFDSLYDILGPELVNEKIDRGYIEIAPIAFMRGRTLKNCFVIIDEAQNATFEQLVMAVTRIGDNCKMVINGDPYQSDLPNKQQNGMVLLKNILKDIPEVGVIEFAEKDVVRSPIVKDILVALSKYHASVDPKF